MALTRETMRTDPSGNRFDPAALTEDVTHMDDSQLERYVRAAFKRESDRGFLPVPFWEYAYEISGGRPTPGEFFAVIYTTLPSAINGTFTKSGGSKLDFDPEYSGRLESVLTKIMQECIVHEGDLNKELLNVAQEAINAVAYIKFHDGPNSPDKQFENALGQKNSVNATEAREIIKGLKFPQTGSSQLYRIAEELKKDQRYSSLNFTFI